MISWRWNLECIKSGRTYTAISIHLSKSPSAQRSIKEDFSASFSIIFLPSHRKLIFAFHLLNTRRNLRKEKPKRRKSGSTGCDRLKGFLYFVTRLVIEIQIPYVLLLGWLVSSYFEISAYANSKLNLSVMRLSLLDYLQSTHFIWLRKSWSLLTFNMIPTTESNIVTSGKKLYFEHQITFPTLVRKTLPSRQ